MLVPFTVIGSIQFGAALAWAALLVFGESKLGADPALLYATGMLLLATVSLAGLAIVHGRWAHRLAGAVIGLEAVAASLAAASPWWWGALALSASAALLTVGPWIAPHVRRLPPPAPLPWQSMGLMLGLLALPTFLALTNDVDGWMWVLASAGVVVAWAYGRAFVAGLWAARLGLIPLAIAAIVSGGPWRASVVAAGTGTLTWLAWTEGARTPVVPLEPRRVSPRPVLPELAPPEVLDAAGYDERGRPRGTGGR